MKINDQLTWNSNQKPHTIQHDRANFEHWLERPTKQSSGDEYYWQHQSHLQQSNLCFDTKPLEGQSKKVLADRNELAFYPSAPLYRKNSIEQKNADAGIEISHPMAAETSHSGRSEGPPIMVQNPQEILHYAQNDWLRKNEASCTTNPIHQTKELKTPIPIHIKNHHLFLQNDQAELTINTQDLSQHDEKELIQLIEHFLKKKGLHLNHLIINGVKK
jgi:hypothetical protein